MNPETWFRVRVKPQIDRLPNAFGFSIQQAAIVGTPDTLYCINGWFVSLEFKASKKANKRPMQIYNTRRINESKGFGFFVFPENWDEVFNFLFLLSSKGRDYDYDELRRIAEPLLLRSDLKARQRDEDL